MAASSSLVLQHVLLCVITYSCTVNGACTDGEIQLIGGSTLPGYYNQGTIQLCYGNAFGTICGTQWSLTNAAVVCRLLGYYGNVFGWRSNFQRSSFVPGNGTILFTNVTCSGSESSLLSCSHSPINQDTGCTHNDDASVSCFSTCRNGEIRYLEVGSLTGARGTLQICYNNRFGTLCSDGWDLNEAVVACGQGGNYGSGTPYTNAYFGAGFGEIYFTNFSCTGYESSLLSCPHSPIYQTTGCTHSNDAGVSCYSCTEGQVLLGGAASSSSKGTIQMCLKGKFGTICSLGWDTNDAIVVCSQLGYYGTVIPLVNASFGQGIGNIIGSNFRCSGTESSLRSCSFGPTTTSCNHSSDAGVSCSSTCIDGEVRLIGTSSAYFQGTVQMCYANTFGTICSTGWDIREAIVLCNQLGFNGTVTPSFNYFGGQVSRATPFQNFNCIGTEKAILSCPFDRTTRCESESYASVSCSPVCTTGDIRLVGTSASQGTVQICYNNTYGTVCDEAWDTAEAVVVCRYLGFKGSAVALRGAYFGQGAGPILLSGLKCSGSEPSLLACLRDNSVVGSTSCSHSQDAAVICSGSSAMSSPMIAIEVILAISFYMLPDRIFFNYHFQ